MNTSEILARIPQDFSNQSRVWIFQSNRNFSEQEVLEIEMQIEHFYLQWQSHGMEVKGWGGLLFNRFIIIVADEAASNIVSGCSTDGMVRVIKSIERQYNVNMFDRMSISFLVDGKVQSLPFNQLKYAMEKGYIDMQTLYFNNTIENLEELKTKWLIPIQDSWLKDRI